MESNNSVAVNLVVALRAEAEPIVEHFGLRERPRSRYPLFSNGEGNLWLIVTGVGRGASSSATTYLGRSRGSGRGSVWLNVGIAGQREFPLGTCRLANWIEDAMTGESWDLPICFETSLKTATLRTVAEPEGGYRGDGMYDMEAAGFYAAASHFSDPRLIQVLKVISDNRRSGVDNISRKQVGQLIADRKGVIEQTINSLGHLSAQIAPPSTSRIPVFQPEFKR